jgi:hypothetical protein
VSTLFGMPLGGKLTRDQIAEVQDYAEDLKYPSVSLVYGGNDEDDYLYCLSDNRELELCREMIGMMGYPNLECRISAISKDQLEDSLAYNNLKVSIWLCILSFIWIKLCQLVFGLKFCSTEGLILSTALEAKKDAKDETARIAFGNLRSEVIELWHKVEEKDEMLNTLARDLIENRAEFKNVSEEKKL